MELMKIRVSSNSLKGKETTTAVGNMKFDESGVAEIERTERNIAFIESSPMFSFVEEDEGESSPSKVEKADKEEEKSQEKDPQAEIEIPEEEGEKAIDEELSPETESENLPETESENLPETESVSSEKEDEDASPYYEVIDENLSLKEIKSIVDQKGLDVKTSGVSKSEIITSIIEKDLVKEFID